MNRELIDRGCERTILGLVLAALIFGPLALGGVRASEFVVLHWLVVAALGVWAVRIWAAPKFRFLLPPVTWAVVPFVAYAAWRYRTADIEFVARQEFIQVLLAALLFLIVVNNLYGQESVRILCFTLVFFAMALAMYGIYQQLRGSEQIWGLARPPAYLDRASGTYICPNHLAGFLEMIVPIGVALTLGGRVGAVPRISLAYASLVGLVGIGLTQSRGGWAGTAAGLLVLCGCLLWKKGQRWIALATLAVVLSLGGWLYTRSATSERVAEIQLSGQGREVRLRLWNYALQIWKTSPWIGVGADHFDYRFRVYREADDRSQGRPGRAHNDYINTLADYGVIGLLLVLLPLGVGAWSVVRSWPHLQRTGGDFGQKQSSRAAIVLGAASGLVALLVHSFSDFNLHIPANAFVAATLLAVIAGHLRFATERYWLTARWPWALAGTAALGACFFYLVPQGVARTREAALLRQAEKLPDGAEKKIALMKSAFAADTNDFETAYAIGEQLRAISWLGKDGYEAPAQEALGWFQRAVALNKWDVNSQVRCGMCLDWLDRHEEAAPYFQKALALDPNHAQTRAMMGWHHLQMEHYEEAHEWFGKSLQVISTGNTMARTYYDLTWTLVVEERDKRERQSKAALPK